MISRRRFCAGTAAIAASVPSFPVWSQQEKRAVCYNCSRDWADWGGVLKKFTDVTGIAAPTDNRTSGESLTSLIADKDHPIADFVYFGGDYALRAKDAGVIAPYRSKYWNSVPESLRDPEGYWTALHTGAIGFFINKAAFGKRAIPRSWADLLKPEYDGVVGYYDVVLSAAGYVTALAVNIGLGGTLENFDPAVQYFVKLQKNHPIIPRNTAYARVLSGEIPLLIDFDFNAYRALHRDKANVEVVIPKEGTVSFPYVLTLVKNAPREANGKQAIDFALSDEGQKMWANAFLRPARQVAMDESVASRFLPASEYARSKTINIAQAYAAKDHFASFIKRYKAEVI
jgi:putative spermidine/putrescine transport system substrate-binding protein